MSYEYGSVKVTVEARPENMSKALDFLKAVKPAYDQEMLSFFIQDWERAMASAAPAPAGRSKFVIDEFYDSTYPVVYGLYELGKAIPDLKLRVTMKIANSVSDIKCTMTMENKLGQTQWASVTRSWTMQEILGFNRLDA